MDNSPGRSDRKPVRPDRKLGLKRLDWKFVLKLAVSLLLLGWLVAGMEWGSIWSTLAGIDPVWLLPAAGWIVAAVVVSVIKWKLILDVQGLRVGWLDLWRAYWIGLFFNNFLPSSIGGDAFRVLHVGRLTEDTAGVTASVVVERLLSSLAMAGLGLAASYFAVRGSGQVMLLFALLLAASLLLTGWLAWGWIPAALAGGQDKIRCFIRRFVSSGWWLRRHPKTLLWTLFWSLVFQVTYVAANYSLFQGLGLFQVGPGDAMFVIPAAGAIAMIPLSINGYGIREGAYVYLLAPLGVSSAPAFSSSVLFAFLVSLCSLWGGVLWLKSDNRKREVHDASFERS
jgi:uncharacterized membrane protein YbhN (UPF0104 family)